jgi:hypothetical protein
MLNLFISRTTAAITPDKSGKSHWASKSFFQIIWADNSQYSKRERFVYDFPCNYDIYYTHLTLLYQKKIYFYFFSGSTSLLWELQESFTY